MASPFLLEPDEHSCAPFTASLATAWVSIRAMPSKNWVTKVVGL